MRQIAFFGFILAIYSIPVGAVDARFEDWMVDVNSPDKKFAYSVNQAGEVIGQLCTYASDGNNCVYIFTMNLECKVGNEYPVLVNSDVGAIGLKVVCDRRLSGGSYRYFFYYDDIDEAISTASNLSMVFPTDNDQFRVLRFSLSGSLAAIKKMREAADQMQKNYRPATETLL